MGWLLGCLTFDETTKDLRPNLTYPIEVRALVDQFPSTVANPTKTFNSKY